MNLGLKAHDFQLILLVLRSGFSLPPNFFRLFFRTAEGHEKFIVDTA